jgi:alcohol dehydrogenase class IV
LFRFIHAARGSRLFLAFNGADGRLFPETRYYRPGSGSRRRVRHWVARVVYAFAAALFNRHEHVGQGEANAALTPMVMRKLGLRDPEAMCRIASALAVWREGDPVAEAPERAATELERIFSGLGMPIRLSQTKILKESLAFILDNSMKNFNADPKREFIREKDMLGAVLEATW